MTTVLKMELKIDHEENSMVIDWEDVEIPCKDFVRYKMLPEEMKNKYLLDNVAEFLVSEAAGDWIETKKAANKRSKI